jgi:hypothetical protein
MSPTADRGFEIRVAAHEDPEIVEFVAQQQACYARFGARVSPPPDDPLTQYLLVAIERQMVAGIRIHRRGALRLPLERYFETNDHLARELDRRTPDGLAELSGLWSNPLVAGTGIGGFVVGAAVAVAPWLRLRHLCSFAHQFNRFTRDVGFVPDPVIGTCPYPDARYESTINWCDAFDLAGAAPHARARILELRTATRQLDRLQA